MQCILIIFTPYSFQVHLLKTWNKILLTHSVRDCRSWKVMAIFVKRINVIIWCHRAFIVILLLKSPWFPNPSLLTFYNVNTSFVLSRCSTYFSSFWMSNDPVGLFSQLLQLIWWSSSSMPMLCKARHFPFTCSWNLASFRWTYLS